MTDKPNQISYKDSLEIDNIDYENTTITYTLEDRMKYGPNIPTTASIIGQCCFLGLTTNSINNFAFPYIQKHGFDRFKEDMKDRMFDDIPESAYLTSMSIPSNILEIGDTAFTGCVILEDLKLPHSITKIGYGTFAYNFALTKIVLPSNLKELGKNCFCGCIHLKEIVIPEGIKELREHMFSDCMLLQEVVVPSSVTKIESYAFSGCNSLTKLVVKNEKCHFVGAGIIDGCVNLKVLNIPKTNKYLSKWHLNELEKEIIKEIEEKGKKNATGKLQSVNYIDFMKMNEQEKQNVQDVIYTIEDSHKHGNVIPKEISVVGNSCFAGLTNNEIQSVVFPFIARQGYQQFRSKVEKKQFNFSLKNVELTEVTFNDKVREIRDCAFAGCISLKNVSLPQTVKMLQFAAFAFCFELSSIEIPLTVKTIGNDCFAHCFNLKKIILPTAMKEIKERTFYECYSLSEIIVPSSVIKIESQAFYNCSSLTKLVIENKNCQFIGKEIIEKCDKLKEFTIPTETQNIRQWKMTENEKRIVFKKPMQKKSLKVTYDEFTTLSEEKKEEVKDVVYTPMDAEKYGTTIPKEVSIIGKECFSGVNDNEIDTILFPILQEQGYDVLKEKIEKKEVKLQSQFCYLNELTIPENIKEIENLGCFGCVSLKNIELPKTITSIGFASFGFCFALKSITLPNQLQSLGNDCFAHCINLKEVILPEGLKEIKAKTFYCCLKLDQVVIPYSVTKIESQAFFGCFELTKLVIKNPNCLYDEKDIRQTCRNLTIELGKK